MTIARFDKERFEAALAQFYPGFNSLGLDQGEETYAVPVTESARILVRSSIDSSGWAADTGDDSIRLWVQVYQPNYKNLPYMHWQACGKKVDAYTTRVDGWDKRMLGKLEILFDRSKQVRRPVNVCPECGKAPWVGFSGSDKNKDRPYAMCKGDNPKGQPHYFQWLDEPMKPGEVIEFEVPVEETVPEPKPDKPVFEPMPQEPDPIPQQLNISMLKANLKAKKQRKAGVTPTMTYKRQPNDSQLAVIEAPVDESIRLMAPPGSGKTFVIEHRYAYLLSQGVDPQTVLVVTFSKKMADEMLARIKETCPQAYDNQISTIHALAYRIISFWDNASPYYGWEVAKDWEVKKIVDELVERYWEVDIEADEQIPGYKEIMTWIDLSKYHGLTIEQSKVFFLKNLGARFGTWLYQIRKDYDRAMANQYKLTFSDMIYLLERQLIENASFRNKWQSRFNHIIVDEAQDTSAQALRVLITLSLAPGQNTVYADWS